MGASVGCTDDRKEMGDTDDESNASYDIRQEAAKGRQGKNVRIDEKGAWPGREGDREAIVMQKVWRGRQVRKELSRESTGQKDEGGGDADNAPAIDRMKSNYREPLLSPTNAEAQEELDEDDFEDEEAEGRSWGSFKMNLAKASRTAMACVICSLPVLVPDVYRELDPAYSSMIGGGVVLMVVFTVYGNLGITIQLAWQGFIGTFMACVPVHVLAALMPHGAAGDKYNPLLVHFANVMCIFFGIWLNISKNAKMFFVCYHVYFIIEFMNPNSATQFNTTWQVDIEAYTTTTIVTSTMGLSVAIFVLLFPWPIRATSECRSQAIASVNLLTDLVDGLVNYYASAEQSVRIVRMEVAAVALRNAIDGMGANIDGSWWETFNIGRAGRSRALLGRHLTMLGHMSDTMFSLQVCVAREDFGQTHIDVMGKINTQVLELVDKTKMLLRLATLAANDGDVDRGEKRSLLEAIAEVKGRIADLAIAFDAARKEIMPDRRICAELQSESFYCYALSTYARRAVDYAQELLERPPRFCSPELPSIFKDMEVGFCGIFDPNQLLWNADHRSFTLRNTLSVIVAFYIGFWCKGYDGAPGGTVAVLISTFSGSALQKNLDRLQAVTLAMILPHLIGSMMGQTCNPVRIFAQGATIVAYEVMTCYIYYSSSTYGYMGCLIAALGVGNLIYPCSLDTSAAQAEAAETAFGLASFNKIVDTSLAVIVMTAVDLWLASSTAAKQATENYLYGLLTCDAFFQACLAKRKSNGKVVEGALVARLGVEVEDRRVIEHVAKAGSYRTPGIVMKYISLAEAMGEEANKEPRYYRVAWPMDFFVSLVKSGYILRGNLIELEHVMQSTSGEYQDVFKPCRGMQAFQDMKQDIVQTMDECLIMVQTILKNEMGKSLPSVLRRLDHLEKIDKLQDLPKLMDAINASDLPELQYPEQVAESLEEDLLCRLNVAFMVMESTVERVADIIKACIKQLV